MQAQKMLDYYRKYTFLNIHPNMMQQNGNKDHTEAG